jgi:glycosyltransferase 2 family protein
MRKFLIAFILFLGIIFVMARISELEAIANTLRQGDWRFLLLAVIVQGLWFINIAASYKVIYQALGITESLRDLVPLVAAVMFTNTVAPSGGMSGIALMMDRARRRGYSPARVAIANTLYIEFDYLGFLAILAVGLLVLFRRDNLNTGELVASGIIYALASLLAILLYLGTRSSTALGKVLVSLTKIINRLFKPFIKRDYLSEDRAHSFAQEVHEGLYALRDDPNKIIPPAMLGLSTKLLMLLNFLIMFLAFGVPVAPGTIVAGFCISYLFVLVSPTPNGLGVVEGALTLALRTMYIPLGTAVVITVAYRAFTFWLPLFIGLISIRWLTRTGNRQQENRPIA